MTKKKSDFPKEKEMLDTMGNHIGDMRKSLDAYVEKRAEKTKDLTEEKLAAFNENHKKIMDPRVQQLNDLTMTYRYFEAQLADAVEVRRVVKGVVEIMETQIYNDGKMPTTILGVQAGMVMVEMNKLIEVNKQSEEISKKSGVTI